MVEQTDLMTEVKLAAQRRRMLREGTNKIIERSFNKGADRPLGPSTPFEKNNIGRTFGGLGKAQVPQRK